MATRNITLTQDWSLVVGAAVDAFLLSAGDLMEVAATGSDSVPPVVSGHAIRPGFGVTRALIGDGAIWARAIGSPSALAVVS